MEETTHTTWQHLTLDQQIAAEKLVESVAFHLEEETGVSPVATDPAQAPMFDVLEEVHA